jgi:hypothetical protein
MQVWDKCRECAAIKHQAGPRTAGRRPAFVIARLPISILGWSPFLAQAFRAQALPVQLQDLHAWGVGKS